MMGLVVLWIIVDLIIAPFCLSDGTRPDGADPQLDCNLRRLSMEYANKILPARAPNVEVFDALQLASLCNDTRPLRLVSNTSFTNERNGDIIIYADANHGSDQVGDGSFNKPFQSLGRAVVATRVKKFPIKRKVMLRVGTYFLNNTLVLGHEDSGLSIISYGQEEVIISGGIKIHPSWKEVHDGIFVSKVASYIKEFNQLFVDGRREIRARWPNSDPETSGLHTIPTGWVKTADWSNNPPPPSKKETSVKISKPVRNSPNCQEFSMKFDGYTERYQPARSFWGGTSRPTALHYAGHIGNKTFNWSNPKTGVVHAFHGSHWGGWQFSIEDISKDTIKLDPWGGQQEARGNKKGAEWYVENILEELDSKREWFLDIQNHQLWYMPNSTSPPAVVIVPVLKTLIMIKGPVQEIYLTGLTFKHSTTTFLESYEVTSGGDWSIHRGGAVFMENISNATINHCIFDSLGGNGLFINNYARNVRITDNEFKWIGDSAIAVIGSTRFDQTHNKKGIDLMDGTAGNQPRGTFISRNLIHEIGIFGKQTSAFVQSLATNTTLSYNIMFNGPRAGINWNDGFGGGNVIEWNLLFNWVRETTDHGAFNSWDRLPYFTNTSNSSSEASTNVALSIMRRNLIWNNYAGRWPIDHDDCSQDYLDYENYLIYGGAKNYKGQRKQHLNNIYVYADLNGQKVCATDDSINANDVYANNICVHTTGNIYRYSRCDPKNLNATVDITANNSFFSQDGKLTIVCKDKKYTLEEYQKEGYDIGSTVQKLPKNSDIIRWGRKLLL